MHPSIAVQIAQSFGVRVHLLGITPSRGSQALSLLQEADTTTEWDKTTVAKFLSYKPAINLAKSAQIPPSLVVPGQPPELVSIARALHSSLDSNDIGAFAIYHQTQRGLPAEIDGKLLAQARSVVGRNLDPDEKRKIRAAMVQLLQGKII